MLVIWLFVFTISTIESYKVVVRLSLRVHFFILTSVDSLWLIAQLVNSNFRFLKFVTLWQRAQFFNVCCYINFVKKVIQILIKRFSVFIYKSVNAASSIESAIFLATATFIRRFIAA